MPHVIINTGMVGPDGHEEKLAESYATGPAARMLQFKYLDV